VQGRAPYWFDVGATAYVGDAGRAAFRFEVDYELSLTQRLILQPRAEINAYSSQSRGNPSSEATVGIRLRYELSRKIAPYLGLEATRNLGGLRESGYVTGDTRCVVGVRLWY
jgi:copper resistance protein B